MPKNRAAQKGPDPSKFLTREEAATLFKDIDRFPEFCERILRIIPIEGGKAIPFVLNAIQRWFFEEYLRAAYKAGTPIRVIILKMRQSGMSTLVEAFTFWCALGHKSWSSLVVASVKAQSRTVFRMCKRFHKLMPKELGLPEFMLKNLTWDLIEWAKPDERRFKYDPKKFPGGLIDLDSRIEIRSAEEDDYLGRAGTYQTVHASEVAMWKNLTASLSSLLACVHEQPETAVILETTAKGLNEFYDFWMNESVEDEEIPSMWRKCFIPWYWDSRYEYARVRGGGHPSEVFKDDYEEGLFARIQADQALKDILAKYEGREITNAIIWEKLWWRRWAITNKCGGDLDKFNQEFPSTENEAFLFSGASVWDSRAIQSMETHIRMANWRGQMLVEYNRGDVVGVDTDRKRHNLETQMVPHERGPLKVFAEPVPSSQYLVTVDIAEGKAVEGMGEEHSKFDWSVVNVFDLTQFPDLDQAAIWHGSISPHGLGYLCVAIATWYNNAMLSWETNGIGLALNGPILEHCRYQNIYMSQQFDSVSQRTVPKPGWHTTGRTKPKMVADGTMYVVEKHLILHDEASLAEMKVYSRVDENKFAAAKGHDDRVMAILQACSIAESYGELIKRKATRLKAETLAVVNGERILKDLFPWEDGEGGGKNPYLGGDL